MLIFDFDGTLAETERDGHRIAYNRAFEDLGLTWHWDVARYGGLLETAGGRERLERYLADDDPPRPRGDDRELVARIHDRKGRRFAEIAGAIALRPGVRRVVLEAKAAGFGLAIATTARRDGVEAVLAHVPDVRAAFDAIVTGDDVAAKKPAPDVYLAAAAALGVSPEACLAIEDSEIGLAAARAAGITTLVVSAWYTRGQDFSGAAAVLESFESVTVPYLRTLLGER